MASHHQPVLLQEVVQSVPSTATQLLDCTLGRAGHSQAFLEHFPTATLTAFDRDPQAIEEASEALSPHAHRVILHHAAFSQLPEYLDSSSSFDFIFADLGVSSPQLDQAHRGFSFMHDGPLDMRMNPDDAESAADWVNERPYDALKQIFKQYADIPKAAYLAKRIVQEREQTPFQTTHQLANFIEAISPRHRQKRKHHPATLVFQALRIAVNQEMQELEDLLSCALSYLKPQGRLAILTFHSLEDRVVKQTFKQWESPCACPPHLPYCVCGKTSLGHSISRKPIVAQSEEVQGNPRSRSAKLRVFEKEASDAH